MRPTKSSMAKSRGSSFSNDRLSKKSSKLNVQGSWFGELARTRSKMSLNSRKSRATPKVSGRQRSILKKTRNQSINPWTQPGDTIGQHRRSNNKGSRSQIPTSSNDVPIGSHILSETNRNVAFENLSQFGILNNNNNFYSELTNTNSAIKRTA